MPTSVDFGTGRRLGCQRALAIGRVENPPEAAVHRFPSNVGRAVVASTAVALLFAFSFLGALHAPAPHDLPVGLAGPAPAVAAVEQRLADQAPGAFAVSRYPDEAA